ncbi:MAG: TolB family protein [Actinomycetota bacterium]
MRADPCETPRLERARALVVGVASTCVVALVAVQIPGAHAAAPVSSVAFVSDRDGDPEIFTIAPDGSGSRQLTSNTFWDTEPAWSPDGSKIAFSSNRDGDDDIYLMGATGGAVTNLTDAGTGADGQPDWAPDGSRIAFVRDGDVYTVPATGGSPTKIGRGVAPAWSPDGSKLAVIRPEQGSNDVYLMNPDGSGAVALTSGLEADLPDWSPDGTKIAVESTTGVDGESQIVIINSNGSGQTILEGPGEDFAPSWSPDGKSLAITNLVLDADVVVATLAGSRRKLVSGTSYDFLPAWSPCVSGCPAATPTWTPSPTTTGSPTGSPTPTSSPTVSPGPGPDLQASSISLQFLKTRRVIKAAGGVRPDHPGRTVRVLLSRRQGGRWVKVAVKEPLMNSEGVYSTTFRNPRREKACRLQARFAGDVDHLPSTRTKRFRC